MRGNYSGRSSGPSNVSRETWGSASGEYRVLRHLDYTPHRQRTTATSSEDSAISPTNSYPKPMALRTSTKVSLNHVAGAHMQPSSTILRLRQRVAGEIHDTLLESASSASTASITGRFTPRQPMPAERQPLDPPIGESYRLSRLCETPHRTFFRVAGIAAAHACRGRWFQDLETSFLPPADPQHPTKSCCCRTCGHLAPVETGHFGAWVSSASGSDRISRPRRSR